MEATITADSLECMVWLEIPIKALETGCWGVLLCQAWGPNLKQCPNRCPKDNFILQENKFLQRMLSGVPVKCDFCTKEFSRKAISAHKSIWEANIAKSMVYNENLHSCVLYKTQKENSWFCDGSKIIIDGWANSGKTPIEINKDESYYCKDWDVDYWTDCIVKYNSVKDEKALRKFGKSIKHSTHNHKLQFIYGEKLPEIAKQNWLGKYKSGGCQGKDREDSRYFAWFDWRFVMWEYCVLSPVTDFIQFVSLDHHEHPLYLKALSPHCIWKCNGKDKDCMKPSHEAYFNQRIAYKCELCDFYSCISCTRKKSIQL